MSEAVLKDKTQSLQLGSQFKIIVDLAVVGDPDRMARIAHRLGAIFAQVDDGQSPVAETNVAA